MVVRYRIGEEAGTEEVGSSTAAIDRFTPAPLRNENDGCGLVLRDDADFGGRVDVQNRRVDGKEKLG